MYDGGVPVGSICKHFGIARKTVYARLKKLGKQPKTIVSEQVKHLDPVANVEAKVLQLHKEGYHPKYIAMQTNLNEEEVRNTINGKIAALTRRFALNNAEEKFVKELARGKTNEEAAKLALGAKKGSDARTRAAMMVRSDNVKMAIRELMEEAGIGRKWRIDKLAEHMDSVAPEVSLKALDIGFKLADDYPQKKVSIEDDGAIINFIQINKLTELRPPQEKDKAVIDVGKA